MTGQIIHFQVHRDLKRGRLYHEQPVPRGTSPRRAGRSLEQQVKRITQLLEELQELADKSGGFPPEALGQARATIENARKVLRPQPAPIAGLDDDFEADPQPRIDDEKLERMYRDLNRDV